MYPEFKQLNLPKIAEEILADWEENKIFEQSITNREGATPWVFYEGPPSANGMPGIHHVMARSIKDIFCRYKTLQGFQVKRKAGWDTHGLPIELSVEKSLGITKEDIGKKITIEQYNIECRKDVMKYTDKWEAVTKQMGYWVDMQDPYITYDNKYIESVWWLLGKLYAKGMLYKGFTIQPYSPAAGTGLSTHELNQPGCYRNVKDRTAVALFKLHDITQLNSNSFLKRKNDTIDFLRKAQLGIWQKQSIYFCAWTTTPWTLPSNTALAVGKNIEYLLVQTINILSSEMCLVILAKSTFDNYFYRDSKDSEDSLLPSGSDVWHASEDLTELIRNPKNEEIRDKVFSKGKIRIFSIIAEFKGSVLEGIQYEQLLNFGAELEVSTNASPLSGRGGGEVNAFRVILDDFVTTEDGTGIVHIAPSFGADDSRVAKQNGIGSLTLVDKRGKFLPEVQDGVFLYGEEFVKEAYLSDAEKEIEFKKQKQILEASGKIKDLKQYLSVDERIVLKLQEEGKLFKKETYEHSYPHCWRTDKPVLYYPLDSWFIKSTDMKDRMIALNKTINWKPEATGTGRFGNWLENLNDWNLSRSRFWGIPIPIFTSEDGEEQICISSVAQLKSEIDNAIAKGMMTANPLSAFVADDMTKENYDTFDLHKPYVDNIFLEKNGKKLTRETDLIDVWFDSGAMPFAQMHFPFENVKEFSKSYPADFIAEGVDQTRGWFFTLHAISAMLKEEIQAELQKNGIAADDKTIPGIAYKNVVSNGLVLDKNGQKMSKRLGNAVDPFIALPKYGADAVRWYMISNAAPWDNLKFDEEGITEVQRNLFGTLYNTYNFFALYANIDGFSLDENNMVAYENLSELDRWVLSKLQTLIKETSECYEDFEPHRAARLMENFVDRNLSNWYVRLSRRRFWKQDSANSNTDKRGAYETLLECLKVTAQLMSPIAPFFSDWLYKNLSNSLSVEEGMGEVSSVHLSNLPITNLSKTNLLLEQRMDLAQNITSMILSIRKKENIRVRQPLSRVQIPVLNDDYKESIQHFEDLIKSEVNIKKFEYVTEEEVHIVKNMKLNFKTLGKKYGTQMKAIQEYAKENGAHIIKEIEQNGKFIFAVADVEVELLAEDVEIIPVDIPGWKVANSGNVTVALDIHIDDELRNEGIAREIVNRIQNLRKDNGYEVVDKINVQLQSHNLLNTSVSKNIDYIRAEILANSFEIVEQIADNQAVLLEIEEGLATKVYIEKV